MDPLFKTMIFRTVAFFVWTSLSAWLFVTVEHTEKDEAKEKDQLLLSLFKAMAFKYNMTEEDFKNFSSTAFEALSKPSPKWTFLASLIFVVQATTTVGYGNITPKTPEGQMLCIFLCLLGIPITLLLLNSVGAVIAKLVNTLVKKFESKILKREEPMNVEKKSAMILFLFMVLGIVMNALVLIHLEDWTFVEALYFWFVTVTTMGFGDYIPGKLNPTNISRENSFAIFIGFFELVLLLGGLCIVSSVFNSIMAALDERNWWFTCSARISRRIQGRVDTVKEPDDENMTSKRIENLGLENLENTEN